MKTIQQTIHFSAHNAEKTIQENLAAWEKENKVQRLWKSDASLWTNTNEAQWTGWLNVTTTEFHETARIEALANEIKAAGFQSIVLLGMGGSSLCPALMAKTFENAEGYPRLHVLDSTDPLQIRHLENKIDLKNTFFIVSSKSGSTLEPNIFKRYFYARLQAVLEKSKVGDRFLAITDPDTTLAIMAKKEGFKTIFYGIPSIGGRYSALSNFGMVPSGLMGMDVATFLQPAAQMVQACSINSPQNNPGVLLGIILGVCAQQGRDKVTLVLSPDIRALGAWLEQLLAESTGKIGKGLIPVDQEPLGKPAVYGDDRVFVYIRLENAPDPEQDRAIALIEQSGQTVVHLYLPDKQSLSAELFLWEMATAVAGSVIGVNPFDQPDVEGSKVRALQLTTDYERTQKIPQPQLIFEADGMQLFTDDINAQEITQRLNAPPSIEAYLQAHLSRIHPGDYVDLSAFIEMSDTNIALLQKNRTLIRDAKKVATCLGFGPRFLHSTGQVYKGGPNTGVFLQITCDHDEDIQVPDQHYTFGLVIKAQAQADFEVLAQRGRRVLRIHIGNDVQAGLQKLYEFLRGALLNK
jgi:transaldolase/glucose-6-phosphate isomerase